MQQIANLQIVYNGHWVRLPDAPPSLSGCNSVVECQPSKLFVASSILVTRSRFNKRNAGKVTLMGRVFIEQAMQVSGVNRTDLIGLLAFIKRSGRATSPADAIRRLEAGEFDVAELQELMIRQYETKRLETVNSETDVDKQINAPLAHPVEQLICNQQVVCSSRTGGTIIMRVWRNWQTHQIQVLARDRGGSSPFTRTITKGIYE